VTLILREECCIRVTLMAGTELRLDALLGVLAYFASQMVSHHLFPFGLPQPVAHQPAHSSTSVLLWSGYMDSNHQPLSRLHPLVGFAPFGLGSPQIWRPYVELNHATDA
jgi:hypothetical protein